MSQAIFVGIMLLLCLGCGGPQLPTGPRATGAGSTAFVGDAQIDVRYRYEPLSGRLVVFYVDVTGKEGDAGEIAVDVRVEGMEVVEGATAFKALISKGKTHTHEITLGAMAAQVATVTVTTRDVKRDLELSSDVVRLLVAAEEGIRECRPTDDACR